MLKLVTKKTVPCTRCGQPIEITRLNPGPPNEDFAAGVYQGRCPKCGAWFEYDAAYIKELVKNNGN